jgi:hypothetical protein
LFRALDDTGGIAVTLGALGDMALIGGDFAAAEVRYMDSLQAWRAVSSLADIGVALCDLGLCWPSSGVTWHRPASNWKGACRSFSKRATLATQRSRSGISGVVAADEGEYGGALALLCESLSHSAQLGDRHGMANTLEELAWLAGPGPAERARTRCCCCVRCAPS